MIRGSKISAWLTDTATPSKLNIPAAPTHSKGPTASSAPAYPIPNATTPTSKAASKNKRGRMRESYKKRKEDGAASLPLPVTPCSATSLKTKPTMEKATSQPNIYKPTSMNAQVAEFVSPILSPSTLKRYQEQEVKPKEGCVYSKQ